MSARGALATHAIGPVLDQCRRHIDAFRQAPTSAEMKRNVRGGTEPVCEADRRIQEILVDHFQVLHPGVPVIGEEGRETLEELPDDCLIVDPIDGTAPFLSGSPFYGIAICLVEAGRPVEAVVDLPAFGLRVNSVHDAVHVAGDIDRLPHVGPTTILASPSQAERLSSTLAARPGDMTVQPVPTATVKMTLVALGRAPAAVYLPTEGGGAAPWDYAAAALLCTALGGRAVDDTGQDLATALPAPIRAWQATGAHSHLPNLLS